jgi:ribosome biogenesis GTPase
VTDGWEALQAWGLAPFREAFAPFEAEGLAPGRVLSVHRGAADVVAAWGEERAPLAGKLRKLGQDVTVGDVVALARAGGGASVEAVLPRRTALVRKAAGRAAESQVMAANVDVVFVVTAAEGDLNARRLERYLATVSESGATPVVLVTKLDLCAAPEEALALAREAAPGAEVLGVSAATGEGLAALDAWLAPARTVALVGSSGVGKSTLVNRWMGDARQATRPLADDGRGRHTTTRRELFRLPSGALAVDTPGLRELAPWDEEGLAAAFPEVGALAARCRFADCGHATEPGCAVRAALADGSLPQERFEAWEKLEAEGRALAARRDAQARSASKARGKSLERAIREVIRLKGR